jgi:colanic acid biosynthesis glycosyl transferase WcaI
MRWGLVCWLVGVQFRGIRTLTAAEQLSRRIGYPCRCGGGAVFRQHGRQAGARSLSDEPGLQFVFCGNGAGKAELVRLTQGLPNVRFLDLQPMARLNDLVGLADIHLLPQRADAADLVMSSKLTGMLASGRPVVASAHADTELGRVLSSCGVLVTPGDAVGFCGGDRETGARPVAAPGVGPGRARPCGVASGDRPDFVAV